MDEIEAAMEQALNEWLATWNLADMTIKEVYEAGFRHGHERATMEKAQ